MFTYEGTKVKNIVWRMNVQKSIIPRSQYALKREGKTHHIFVASKKTKMPLYQTLKNIFVHSDMCRRVCTWKDEYSSLFILPLASAS